MFDPAIYIYIRDRALFLEPLHVFSQRWQHKHSLMRRSHVKIARRNVFTILGSMATLRHRPSRYPSVLRRYSRPTPPFSWGHLSTSLDPRPPSATRHPATHLCLRRTCHPTRPRSAKFMSTSFAILGAKKNFLGFLRRPLFTDGLTSPAPAMARAQRMHPTAIGM